MSRDPRAIVLVLDSVGAGELPDAHLYGDQGSNTLSNTARVSGGLRMPNLGALGLGNITPIEGVAPAESPRAGWGRNAERSPGKDTTTGHWEMMGVVLDQPFPTYPDGFPPEVMDVFERLSGYGWLGNYAASGTQIIQELGDEHVASGKPIIYTSADSVFQVAAHEDVISIDELYRICRVARDEVCVGPHAVGRIIARPFIGPDDSGQYVRTHRRRDFAVEPFGTTALDTLESHGLKSYGIGKIGEIFAWRGICESPHSENNMHGFSNLVARVADESDNGFVFANLVDFDMVWGHRNDVDGYARGLEAVDARLPELFDAMIDGDLFILTADHGCDPTTPSTDHSREYTPLIAFVKGVNRGVDLGVRDTFADIGATVLDFYGLGAHAPNSTSFLAAVKP